MGTKRKQVEHAAPKAPSRRPAKQNAVRYDETPAGSACVLSERPEVNGAIAKGRGVAQPFSGAIHAGKNTYVYDAHTYHTKVPPQGIEKLIAHYTLPGQTVLDPSAVRG